MDEAGLPDTNDWHAVPCIIMECVPFKSLGGIVKSVNLITFLWAEAQAVPTWLLRKGRRH